MYSPDAAVPYPGYEFNPHVDRAPQGWSHAVTVLRPTFCFVVPLRGVIVCRFPRGCALSGLRSTSSRPPHSSSLAALGHAVAANRYPVRGVFFVVFSPLA